MKKKNIKTHSKKKKATGLIQEKCFAEAAALYEQICRLDPRDADAWENRGLCLGMLGQKQNALNALLKALELNVANAKCYYNAAVLFRELENYDKAIEFFKKACKLNNDYIEAYRALGELQLSMNLWSEAEKTFIELSRLLPSAADIYANLGSIQQAIGKLTHAIDSYKHSLKIDGTLTSSLQNLANAYAVMGKYKQSIETYMKCLEIDPNNRKAISNYLLTLNYISELSIDYVYEQHVQYAKKLCYGLSQSNDHVVDLSFDRKLRIGYISSDFRLHSVAYFIEPVLKSHNKDEFEVYCYYGAPVNDAVTERFINYADQWRPIYGKSIENVCNRIISDKIDILIDLSGHTASNHLPVLCKKPAPVQITYLGYPNTTGLETIDYRITDSIADPVSIDACYSEKLLRTDACFLAYQPLSCAPDVNALPFKSNGYITLGSFNNLAKIGPQVIELWINLLTQLPESRLIIKNPSLSDKEVCEVYLNKFRSAGIDSDRVELVGLIEDVTEHLKLYERIDIALDTFPYNGTTTTCEALWMGVPVICCLGDRHASRVSASILSCIGLPDLIADNEHEYIEIASNLSLKIDYLEKLRLTMRQRLLESPLCDYSGFTHNIEKLYKKTWLAHLG